MKIYVYLHGIALEGSSVEDVGVDLSVMLSHTPEDVVEDYDYYSIEEWEDSTVVQSWSWDADEQKWVNHPAYEEEQE